MKEPRGCRGTIAAWIVSALAVSATAWLLPGVEVDSFVTALFAAVAIGFANAIVRPLLILLTLPVTLLTLGLFLLIVNGLSLQFAAWLIDGFSISGLGSAVLASVVLAVVSAALDAILIGDDDED